MLFVPILGNANKRGKKKEDFYFRKTTNYQNTKLALFY